MQRESIIGKRESSFNCTEIFECYVFKVGHYILIFFCVGVMYSGEYDVCDVTLSVYPHRARLKNMPGHGGNRTYEISHTRTDLTA